MSDNGNSTAPEAVSRKRVKAPEQRQQPVFLPWIQEPTQGRGGAPASTLSKSYVVMVNGVATIKTLAWSIDDDSVEALIRSNKEIEKLRDKLMEA